jgi:hypothetical protein
MMAIFLSDRELNGSDKQETQSTALNQFIQEYCPSKQDLVKVFLTTFAKKTKIKYCFIISKIANFHILNK